MDEHKSTAEGGPAPDRLDLEAIKAREAAATKGPWRVSNARGFIEDIIGHGDEHVYCGGHDYDEYGVIEDDRWRGKR